MTVEPLLRIERIFPVSRNPPKTPCSFFRKQQRRGKTGALSAALMSMFEMK